MHNAPVGGCLSWFRICVNHSKNRDIIQIYSKNRWEFGTDKLPADSYTNQLIPNTLFSMPQSRQYNAKARPSGIKVRGTNCDTYLNAAPKNLAQKTFIYWFWEMYTIFTSELVSVLGQPPIKLWTLITFEPLLYPNKAYFGALNTLTIAKWNQEKIYQSNNRKYTSRLAQITKPYHLCN